MADYDKEPDLSLVEDLMSSTSIPLKTPVDDQEEEEMPTGRTDSSASASRSMKPPSSLASKKDVPRKPAYRSYDYEDDYPPDEPFRWSDAWGLICGLILLVFIVCVLTWAYLEDLREARELEEARARGVEL
ncbi:unnamed protein product [Effrenium voratum]|nr:unnamed protein product [Effrenium voratum]